MADKTSPRLTREQAVKAFEDAFEKPVDFDHKPTADEIFALQVLAVAQKQLNEVAEWGNEPCPHHIKEREEFGDPVLEGEITPQKRECGKCWQLLLEKEG